MNWNDFKSAMIIALTGFVVMLLIIALAIIFTLAENYFRIH